MGLHLKPEHAEERQESRLWSRWVPELFVEIPETATVFFFFLLIETATVGSLKGLNRRMLLHMNIGFSRHLLFVVAVSVSFHRVIVRV